MRHQVVRAYKAPSPVIPPNAFNMWHDILGRRRCGAKALTRASPMPPWLQPVMRAAFFCSIMKVNVNE